ncbi:hypothetical protein OOT46_08540 [Aquabacterium sp. A7-Y]|uniref:hypothetical protein n=1 Tax=Aquabacterium sp. A7-Y TaxID=1349605 RepID=UPI00223D97E4|nr:hypothetical protein [Aquabacterium sp. A7-Y]MCW7537895.1 hypothetical protein [Aquabacterium sp. A7-Y]
MAAPRLARPALALALASLVAGVLGGLLRLGWSLPGAAGSAAVGPSAVAHAALMIGSFFGTVIGIERAVALKRAVAFLAPLAAGLGGAANVLGLARVADMSLLLASLLFVAVNVAVVRRQWAAHTLLLLLGALAWLAGALWQWLRPGDPGTLAWGFAFLVLTIAAERLEMTRLMRRRAGARPLLFSVLAALLGGAALGIARPGAGGVLYGVSLVALAAWLMAFDIARRTVRTGGLPRYMAVCLLAGYAWLAVGGLAWAATALGHPGARDTALHAVGLGFVFSMVMGHAPVILPAVARVKLAFGRAFYLPLAALHGSLLLRLAGGAHDPAWRTLGAALNAGSMLLFFFLLAGAALAWRLRHPDAPVSRVRRS